MLSARVARAESDVRALLTLLVISCIGVPILVGANSALTPGEAGKVKAPFCVVDDEGRPLLAVESFNNGAARLALFNRGRKPRAVLLATEKGGRLWVLGSAGAPAASLVADEGGGHFGLCDNSGRAVPRFQKAEGSRQ